MTAPARPRDRSTRVLVDLATALALWFGLTAPAVSPVAGTPAGQTVPAAVTQTEQLAPPPGDVPPDRGGQDR